MLHRLSHFYSARGTIGGVLDQGCGSPYFAAGVAIGRCAGNQGDEFADWLPVQLVVSSAADSELAGGHGVLLEWKARGGLVF